MLTAQQAEIYRLRGEGLSYGEIAKRLGKDRRNVARDCKIAAGKIADKDARLDPGAREVLDHFGLGLPGLHSGWVGRKDEKTGEWASAYFYLGKDGAPSGVALEDLAQSAIDKVFRGKLARPERPAPAGDGLLVVDLADLHIGKLCVASETGTAYDREEAVRRGLEGTRRLITRARSLGVGHVLFVIGNDIIHVDTPRGTTTSGTPQDTDGTLAVMWDDAFAFYVACIDMLRREAPVSVLYCPSNHDWFAGFSLARAIGAWYRDCPEVSATDYNTSHRHRKYFRFGRNLLGFTHGDGAKDIDLAPLMFDEARGHAAEADRLYWYLHHLHHKIRRRGAGSLRRQTEKDLIGMTVLRDGAGLPETRSPLIEHVRSASAPDGWHDRNGYVNRQAVEAFLHDPEEGQTARLTEYF